MLISSYQDTTRSNSKNMNKFKNDHLKIVHTWLLPRSMEKLPKISLQKTPKNYPVLSNKTGCGSLKHTVLFSGCQHHTHYCTQHYCCWTNQSHRIHHRHGWRTSWLLCINPITKIRYKNLMWFLTYTLMLCTLVQERLIAEWPHTSSLDVYHKTSNQ